MTQNAAWGYERCKDCDPIACPKPSLHVNHIDGPCITWCDGQMRWLTLWERIAMFFGKLNIKDLLP